VAAETRRTVEAVWRIESARLIAGLTRYTREKWKEIKKQEHKIDYKK